MTYVLIGSRAGKHHFPDWPREPKDTDFATDEKEMRFNSVGERRFEYYPIPPIVELYKESSSRDNALTPDQLYTLKVSHVFWDIKWDKTMYDIVWLQKKGCVLDESLFRALYKHWEIVHGPMPRANLDATVEDFFTNGIKNGHDHDRLHELLVGGEPTYVKILKEPNGVAIDENAFWFKLTHSQKLDIIREEVSVMAYERGARQGIKDYRTAYSEQLKAWILHHGPSLEMALFAVRNFDVLRKPLINYKQHLDEKLRND